MLTALFLLVLMLLSAPWTHAAKITVLLSQPTPDYRVVADSLIATLANERKAGLEIQVLAPDDWQNSVPGANSSLIVAVGVSAAQAAVDSRAHIPVLATLLPKQAFEKMNASKETDAARMTALYLDQPLSRQLSLMRVVLPRAQSFGVIFSPQTLHLNTQLKTSSDHFQLKPVLSTINSEDEMFQRLLQILPQVDAMLAIPDNSVLNRLTIRNFLLATYRNRVPVIGYSQSLVDAGVLAAVFSTPAQIGQQSGEMVRQILKGGWPSPTYPRHFSVKVNQNVARSLSISLPDEEKLLQDMRSAAEDH